ncbi:MAG: YceI family protein [Actinomycetota bacterium]|nr:YceI family protein [Actinomycetota bacterium]
MTTFKWTTDSTVALSATSSMHPIHGDLHDIRGEATVEVTDGAIKLDSAPTGYIEADVESLKSGKKLEDKALRKQVEADKYPTIRYEVRSAEGGPEVFKITGAFTFHGVTQEFIEQATAKIEGDTLKVEAEHTFDIQDFGVKPFKILMLKVHPEVKLVLHLVGKA